MNQFLAVTVVLAALGGTLWWLRRNGFASMLPVRRGAARRMECLERLSLSPQHTLHLVRMDGKVLVVASSPAGCSLMHEVADQ
jgi:flagellar biogenesis protein FliO